MCADAHFVSGALAWRYRQEVLFLSLEPSIIPWQICLGNLRRYTIGKLRSCQPPKVSLRRNIRTAARSRPLATGGIAAAPRYAWHVRECYELTFLRYILNTDLQRVLYYRDLSEDSGSWPLVNYIVSYWETESLRFRLKPSDTFCFAHRRSWWVLCKGNGCHTVLPVNTAIY